jgi:hypothetical protein
MNWDDIYSSSGSYRGDLGQEDGGDALDRGKEDKESEEEGDVNIDESILDGDDQTQPSRKSLSSSERAQGFPEAFDPDTLAHTIRG